MKCSSATPVPFNQSGSRRGLASLALALILIGFASLQHTHAQPPNPSPRPLDVVIPADMHYWLKSSSGTIFQTEFQAKDNAQQMKNMIDNAKPKPLNLDVELIKPPTDDQVIRKKCPQNPCEIITVNVEIKDNKVIARLGFESPIPAFSNFAEHKFSEPQTCLPDNDTEAERLNCLTIDLKHLVRTLIRHNTTFHGGHQ